jgi:hypothetical protein
LQLLEQRERLTAEIARIAAPRLPSAARVPDALRIAYVDASPRLLDSGCASFNTAAVDGEACLWATGGWWEERGDAERLTLAEQHVRADRPSWEILGQEADDRLVALSFELGDFEYEIAKVEAASVDDLRALARVASEQFLCGRTDNGVIPYAFVANVLRVIA